MNFYLRVFATFVFSTPLARALENPYDVLGKTLAPFVNLVAKNSHDPNRALSMQLRVIEATKLSPALVGTSASVDLEYPDKLRLRAPLLGEAVTIGREGQNLWAMPGAKIEALIAQADLPEPPKKYRLTDWALPIPEQQLVFLPVLFHVEDAGEQMIGGENCRVLDVRLMPELAHALKAEAWSARLWVRADYKPAKLDLTQPHWHGVFAFEKVLFAPTLPPETWLPPAGENDVMKLRPQVFKQLLDSAFGGSRRSAAGADAQSASPNPPAAAADAPAASGSARASGAISR